MRKKLKLLSLILAICLTFAACSSSSGSSSFDDSYYDGDDTEQIDQMSDNENESAKPMHKTDIPSGYIGIYTVEDLKNSGANETANYILMNDIDLSSIADWEGINNNGTFDGNNYTISNLHSTQGGLFQKSKYVKDLTVKDCVIDVGFSEEKDKFVGGITDIGCSLSNCSVSGTIQLELFDNCGVTKKYAVGGLMGHQEKQDTSKIYGCLNLAEVTGSNSSNGIGHSYDLFVGGIVGLGCAVEYCENRASIELKLGEKECDQGWDHSAAGGIIGSVYMQAGNISYSSNSGDVSTGYYGGGILGFCYEESSSTALTIDSCYNTGNITGVNTRLGTETSVGGVCGYILHYKPIRETTKSKIMNCYNTGTCLSADYCGAVLGYKLEEDATQIQFCAYNNSTGLNITGTNAMYADNKSMSLEEMKDLNNYPFTNKDSVWKNGTVKYPYPVFK